MSDEWTTIFAGPFSRALALQAALGAKGIPARIPDELVKVMDPFITGANPLAVEVRVPAAVAAEAQEIVASAAPQEPELSAAEHEARRVAQLAQRIRWCVVFPLVGWVIGAWLGFRYLAEPAPRSLSAGYDRRTLIIWWVEIFLLVAFIASVAAGR
jgi:hypothetical protein